MLASPAARARAAETRDRLEAVAGSGPGGAILLSDVERSRQRLHRRPAEPVADERPQGKPGLDMTEMRRAIAAAMSRAKREIPHYYLSHEIDLQAAQDWLTAVNADAHAGPAAADGGASRPCHRAGACEGAGTERPVRG